MPELVPAQSFDVVIAGAGLAGSTLALRLARTGARVALLDPAQFPREKLCGEFLSPECWGVFERLGVAGAIRHSGFHAVNRVRITTPHGSEVDTSFRGADGLPGIALSRATLDNLLMRAARSAGVIVMEGTRASGPLIDDGRIRGISARRTSGETVDVHAMVTIAADGRHSGLVLRTGNTRTRSWFRPRLFGLKRHVRIAPEVAEPDGTVGLHVLLGGYCGTCQIEGGLTNLCALLPESVLRQHRGDLDRLAGEQFKRNRHVARMWDASTPEADWKTVAGVRVEASTPRLAGILYAGDCQGTIDPLGGQGMTMALLGAELLAPIVMRALVEGGVDPATQRAYASAWHARFDRRIRLCRLFHHALVNQTTIELLASFKTLAPRLLSACFERTRDRRLA